MIREQTAHGPVEWLSQGEGDRLLVLLHGSASGPGALGTLASALVRPGTQVVSLALDGYAGTRLRAPDPLAAHRAALRAVLDAHAPRRCRVFGHSMGGLVALLGALEDGRIERIGLYEPIVLDVLDEHDEDDQVALRWDRSIVARTQKCIDAGQHECGVKTFVEAWNDVPWDTLPAAVRRRLVASAAQLARETAATSSAPVARQALRALQTPVIVLAGTRSPDVARRAAARLAALLPQATLATLEGGGHMAPVTHPAAVARLLTAFLTED